MPLYPYKCKCGYKFTEFNSIDKSMQDKNCPQCGQSARRTFSPSMLHTVKQPGEANPIDSMKLDEDGYYHSPSKTVEF